MTAVTSAWSVRQFRKVWAAGFCSELGAQVGELALPSLALITLGASAAEASWVRAALLAPFLLVTLWLGVIVDRRRRRPLMIAADLGRGLLLLAVCLLALLGWLTIPMLVAATFALGTLTVLFQLADFSYLPQIVGEHRLVDANAKVSAAQSAVGIAGSGVGGTLVQVLTAPVAVAVNALGYLSSALFLRGITAVEKPPAQRAEGPAEETTPLGKTAPSEETAAATQGPGAKPSAEKPTATSAVSEARAGLRVLGRNRVLLALMAEASVWNFGNEIFMLALSVQILGRVAAGPLVLGIIVTCGGVGAFAGSLLSARLTAQFGYGRSLVASMIAGNTAPLTGVLAAVAAPASAVVALCAAFTLSGVGIGVANSQSTAIRQIAVEAEIRGRVNAGYRLVSWGALAVGALLGGGLTTALGPWTAATIGALLMAVATVPVAFSPVRGMRELTEVGPDRSHTAGLIAATGDGSKIDPGQSRTPSSASTVEDASAGAAGSVRVPASVASAQASTAASAPEVSRSAVREARTSARSWVAGGPAGAETASRQRPSRS